MKQKKMAILLATLTLGGYGTAGALSPATPHYEFDVRARLTPSDCDANGVCNLTDELNQILDECNESPPWNDPRVGCTIHIPAGAYRLSDTIVLCRQHAIYGDGGRGWGSRTKINVDGGVTGFRVAYRDECGDLNHTPRRRADGTALVATDNIPTGGGAWTEIRDLGLTSSACGGECTDNYYGVQLQSRASLESLWINGFTQGVRISASAITTGPNARPSCTSVSAGDDCRSNANGWLIEDSVIQNNTHAGIYVGGGDSNVGLATHVDVAHNCQAPPASLGECANVVDRSFLGSAWVSVHTAPAPAGAPDHSSFILENPDQGSVVIGAYMEQGQEPGRLSRRSVSIGGHSDWDSNSDGLNIEGSDIYGHMRVHNDADPNNPVAVEMGSNVDGSFMSYTPYAIHNGKPLRFGMDLVVASTAPEACTIGGVDPIDICNGSHLNFVNGVRCDSCLDGWYTYQTAGLGIARSIRIHATDRSNVSYGHLVLREPMTVHPFADFSGPVTCPSDVDNTCTP